MNASGASHSSRNTIIIITLIAVGCLVYLAANNSNGGGVGPFTSGSHSVVYTVTGTATAASMTLSDSDGSTSQQSDQALPFSISFEADSGTFLYISAQNSGESGTITVDGATVETTTSNGAYVIAGCSASAS